MKVIFKKHPKPDGSFLAEIKLNRPPSLNALDLEMILAIKNQLNKWKENSCLSAVFLHGEGNKAFCAGGDVRSIYSSIISAKENKEDPGKAVQPFFENEYRLDYLLHTYPCPVVVWGHGFVIGGGAGLFLASSHRIVTESFSLSMPEITIGLFPDVGVSYLLSRFTGEVGWYLALTGCRLNSLEAHTLKIADFYFENAEKEKVFQTLLSSSFKSKEEIGQILKNIQQQNIISSSQENWPEKYQDRITSLFESKELNIIYKKFCDSSMKEDKKWEKNRQTFLQGSPTSAGIICEQLKRAKKCSLKEVFQTDLVLALNCARGFDFSEGVRALLVEKSGSPAWELNSVEQVKKLQIQEYFKSDPDWINPLEDL